MVAIASMFWFMGWRWENSTKRPEMKRTPLVSILVPAYNSEKTIAATVESLQDMDYPKKEIIVVNDSDDKTPYIVKKLGAKIIQSKIRRGKAYSLNQAVKRAKGEILFFVDSDTTVSSNALDKMVPWFSNPKIGAVAPMFRVKNRKNKLTKLISLEHQIQSALFKLHMSFGSMIAFRGCGVAIRRSTFEKMGGWPYTLIEDTDLGAKMVSKGIKIHYEPEALAETIEPETFRELHNQRRRWGKGAAFSFIHHRKFYKKNSQFLLYFLPYIFLSLGISLFLTAQTIMYFIPLVSLYLLSAVTITEIMFFMFLLMLPVHINIFIATTTATTGHIAIMTCGEKGRKGDWLYIIPYILIYVPLTLAFYIHGVLSGIKDKLKKRDELDLKDW